MSINIKANNEKIQYKYFTDRWMILLILWFYIVIKFQLLPNIITDVYLPFIFCFIKITWTKSSYLKVSNEKIIYCHKELPTYCKCTINTKKILRIYFKTLFFTTTDKQYCLIEYYNNSNKIDNILINLERLNNSEKAKAVLINCCKHNNIEIIF